ncbi:MAG: hypothetical protein ABIK28_24655 [Planctomycetota bacterium]
MKFRYFLTAALLFWALAELPGQSYFISDPDSNQILSLGAAFDITEGGTAVGIGKSYDGFYSGALWEAGVGTTLLPILPGDEIGEAYDIIENGTIAGTSVFVEQVGHIYFFYHHAVKWEGGQPIELETVVDNQTGMELWVATCMNSNGQICGWGRFGGSPPSHGFFIDDDVVIDLGQGVITEDINNQGHFVGSYDSSGPHHAFIWKDGNLIDLHDPAVILGTFSQAMAINESDVVVGYSKFDNLYETATVWDHGVITNLGSLGGNPSIAWDINDHGTIVGVTALAGAGGVHAFICRDNEMLDMNDLISYPTDSDWVLVNANAISNNGTIAGDAFCDGSGPRPFIAVPDTKGKFRIYGNGCAGSGGFTPGLHGQGDPTPDGDVSMVCVNGLGGAYGLLLFGAGYDLFEFKPGCTVQILPLIPIQIPLFMGGTGPGTGFFQVETRIPAGITPGTINMQILFADPGGSQGFTITNPLEMMIR